MYQCTRLSLYLLIVLLLVCVRVQWFLLDVSVYKIVLVFTDCFSLGVCQGVMVPTRCISVQIVLVFSFCFTLGVCQGVMVPA